MKIKPLAFVIKQTTGLYIDAIREEEAQMDKMAAHFHRFFNRAYNDVKYDIKKGR